MKTKTQTINRAVTKKDIQIMKAICLTFIICLTVVYLLDLYGIITL